MVVILNETDKKELLKAVAFGKLDVNKIPSLAKSLESLEAENEQLKELKNLDVVVLQ